jgi:hypothetical protein
VKVKAIAQDAACRELAAFRLFALTWSLGAVEYVHREASQ